MKTIDKLNNDTTKTKDYGRGARYRDREVQRTESKTIVKENEIETLRRGFELLPRETTATASNPIDGGKKA